MYIYYIFEKITIFQISIPLHMTKIPPIIFEDVTLRDTLSKKKFALFRQSTYDEKIIS